MITCPYCKAITHQNRAGKTKAGLQRYRCRHCNWKYLPESRRRAHRQSAPESTVETYASADSPQPVAPGRPAASQAGTLDVNDVKVVFPIVLFSSTNHEAVQVPAPTSVNAEVQVEEGRLRDVADSLRSGMQAAARWMNNKAESLWKVQLSFLKERDIRIPEPAYANIKNEAAPQWAIAFPAAANRRWLLLSKAKESASTSNRWGRLPKIALLQSCSLLLIAWTFTQARAGAPWSEVFFWIGFAVLMVPVAMRLYLPGTSRHERIAHILLLGAAFYLIKVMHSPYDFTFTDEFNTIRNVREILENQRLFEQNPELPVTALYPGLATITSLLVSLSGLSTFAAGLLVIGAARLVLFLALFLLYEQVSGSARLGSLATLFYMANANFLFYTAELSYESLALPMAILVLYIVARRETTKDYRIALTVVALLGVFMVVISHHMTSYILTGLLFAASGISILRTWGRQRGPWDLALIAALAVSFWLIYVATYTIHYLSPVLWRAVNSIISLAMQEESSRQLFKSSSTGYVSPLGVQLTVLCSIIIIALGLPIGWLNIWRRYRHKIFFLLLGVISLAYLPMQGLRLTRAGWETANRSSEFLFIGVAFALALATDYIWRFVWHVKSFFGRFVPRGLRRFRIGISEQDGVGHLRSWIQWKSRRIHAAILVVLICGGFMSGWPPQARMPRPYLVGTGSHIVEPQGVEVAKWTFDHLGPDHHIATSKMGAKLLEAYGEQAPFSGSAYGIDAMLLSAVVGPSERKIIRKAGIEYIAYDRRRISSDQMIGLYFFNQKSSPSYELAELETYDKFDGSKGVNRILDSGDIVIYDVRVYLETSEASQVQSTAGSQSPPAVEVHVDQPVSANKTTVDLEDKEQTSAGMPEYPPTPNAPLKGPVLEECVTCSGRRVSRIVPSAVTEAAR